MSDTLARYKTRGGATVNLTAEFDRFHDEWDATIRATCQGCGRSTHNNDTFHYGKPTTNELVGGDAGVKSGKWAQSHANECTALPR